MLALGIPAAGSTCHSSTRRIVVGTDGAFLNSPPITVAIEKYRKETNAAKAEENAPATGAMG